MSTPGGHLRSLRGAVAAARLGRKGSWEAGEEPVAQPQSPVHLDALFARPVGGDHDFAPQHLQLWGPLGLRQGVDHVLELCLFLGGNAIPSAVRTSV